MINESIKKLVTYGLEKGLIEPADKVWATNRLLEALALEEYDEPQGDHKDIDLESTLSELLDYACEKGMCEDTVVHRDLFDTKLMGLITPRPSEVERIFAEKKAVSAQSATDWFYKFSQDTDYIRRYRIIRDVKWKTSTEYGELDITINLSKPEKDPKAIAAAKLAKQSGYPKCLLCYENVGYAGRLNSPARQNHRVIGVTIDGADWGLQYSPYVYYNEHCILFNKAHTPMVIDRSAFNKLLDFVEQYPHYFVGSNADLPIVGGSILSHEHFQGGHYEFPMARAEVERKLEFKSFENVDAGIVKWAMSVIRLNSADREALVELADKILTLWRGYTDEEAFIYAKTDGEPHNTITPIARMRDGRYEMDLVLRNNITTDEHPLGVYHPHAELHHIKKENIGLIEVMGLAVLPSRLKCEMEKLSEALVSGDDIRSDETLSKHADWADGLREKYSFTAENVDGILKDEIGKVFAKVLEHAGVFKRDESGAKAFDRFVDYVNDR
ncbi:UDP-glucose--hexose-1-phosphate uridylyltransferase [Ruminococcus albus]|uniref:Galactose-1-phosphate uridylyltransferase n=1 Tax=Ruminococcus albus TaxID=1264 RepID=A0A1H7F8K2_RUMAL|nr:UDP-glucose--hexose-1-phosphate uridylyltransferase [Ruminococcus albus]SEK20340.1 UTP-hexose-1-phosphate uridylyltransferase [Ruminococcus albus]